MEMAKITRTWPLSSPARWRVRDRTVFYPCHGHSKFDIRGYFHPLNE